MRNNFVKYKTKAKYLLVTILEGPHLIFLKSIFIFFGWTDFWPPYWPLFFWPTVGCHKGIRSKIEKLSNDLRAEYDKCAARGIISQLGFGFMSRRLIHSFDFLHLFLLISNLSRLIGWTEDWVLGIGDWSEDSAAKNKL